MTKGFALKSFILIVGILLVLIVVILAFSNKDESLDDVSLVEKFYDQYINNQLVDNSLITREFEAQLEGQDISIVLCHFSFDDVSIDKIESKDDIVFVYLSNVEDPIKVYTIEEDGELKINNIVCAISSEEEITEEIEEEEVTEEVIEEVEEEEIQESRVVIPDSARNLVDLAKKDLAARLNINASDIVVSELQDVNFSDTSLGMSKPGEAYNQVITPGYIIILEVNNQYYRYHTNKVNTVIFTDQG